MRVDDMPGTCLNPFVFDVNQEESWEKMAEKIWTAMWREVVC